MVCQAEARAGLVGGLGIVPSANIGEGYVLFEPIHGSAPDIAGKGIANPIAAILSSKMMLGHLHEDLWARKIEDAIVAVMNEGTHLTPDLGGKASTTELTDTVISKLSRQED